MPRKGTGVGKRQATPLQVYKAMPNMLFAALIVTEKLREIRRRPEKTGKVYSPQGQKSSSKRQMHKAFGKERKGRREGAKGRRQG